MGGMRISDTRELTTLPKAVPTMTPTAKSTTLPFKANFLNSLRKSGERIGGSRLLSGSLSEGSEGARAYFHSDAIYGFRLNIHAEFSSGRDLRVTSRISEGSASSRDHTGSAHRRCSLNKIMVKKVP